MNKTISGALGALLILGLASGCANSGPKVAPQADLVIHGATLISPEREQPLAEAWVTIRDGHIDAVGTGEAPAATATLDAEGKFLIPGLIDSHVHLAGVPGFPFNPPPELAPLTAAYETQLPRSYLYFGFTTLIDLNVVDRAALERFRRAPLAPDLFDCGGALALANGYPMSFLPPTVGFALYPNFLWDERDEGAIPEGLEAADHTPAAAVGRVAEGGGICIKVHHEDGFGAAKIWPTPPLGMIQKVVEAGRQRGLPVTIHANSYESHRFAADSGADVVVHGLWNWDGLTAPGGELPAEIRQVLDRHLAAGTGIMPTGQVLQGLRDLFDDGYLDDPRLAAVLPAELLAWYHRPEAGWFREQLRRDFDGLPNETISYLLGNRIDQADRVVRYLAEGGGRLLFGSDTTSGPTYANPPGFNGFVEMQGLQRAGVTPRQLLVAATLANAEAFGIDDRYGSIEAGKVANLLLLTENPLETAAAYDSLKTILLHGRPLPRDQLRAAPD
ncbi:MAG: amidohydrolase family protein [Acidobacteriota bacterium]